MSTNPILAMFGRSPFRPLQHHMQTVENCVLLLGPFFEAIIAKDYGQAASVQQDITKFEDEADDQKHELRLHLPNTLFLPVDRRDLLEILTMQDSIANRAKDIAGLMLGREMEIPAQLEMAFLDYVRCSLEACSSARAAINELDELVEVGFRGPEVEHVQSLIADIDRKEKASDNIQVELRARLRQIERDMHPLDAMFLYRILEWLGDLADRAQRVGSRLQLVLAR
ncbi:MAG: TIGR00153 family protein [Gammaproteobacteria bacterium]|nr:TIGR00153 family protein [Gammaproteobacteria bacterium]|tara:strand:+ start:5994 stop:6671 length:678 start_codon:yes stop_codon:yes gene_type:complete